MAGENGVQAIRGRRNGHQTGIPWVSAKASLAQRFGILQFLADQAPELRGMHFQQHRLDRADRGRGHGERTEAEADQGHGLERTSADLAADRGLAAGACACSATMLRAQHGRTQGIEAVRHAPVLAVAGKEELHQVVRAEEMKSALAQISLSWNRKEGPPA